MNVKDISLETLIKAKDVGVVLDGKSVLHDVTFEIKKGEIVTIIGPNGSGKTTLLRVLLGLQHMHTGSLYVDSNIVIGYMPQRFTINRVLPLTVRRFLRLQGEQVRLRALDEVHRVVDRLGIEHLLMQQIHDVSGGELQRVLLARALLMKPDILVLDEPVQGLDIQGQSEFYQLISRLRKEENCSVLSVSHDLHMVMAATDRVVCLNQHVCCEGHPEHVSKHPDYVALFGKEHAQNIAFYTHRHDHAHDAVSGDVIEDENGVKDDG